MCIIELGNTGFTELLGCLGGGDENERLREWSHELFKANKHEKLIDHQETSHPNLFNVKYVGSVLDLKKNQRSLLRMNGIWMAVSFQQLRLFCGSSCSSLRWWQEKGANRTSWIYQNFNSASSWIYVKPYQTVDVRKINKWWAILAVPHMP